MKRTSFFFAVLVMLFTIAGTTSAQNTARTFGAGRFVIDDGTAAPTGLVYLSDQGGSLGIDVNGTAGIVNGFPFPNTCALLDLSSTTKGFLVPRMSGLPTALGGQEAAICGGAPPEGLIVYNLTAHTLDI